MKPWVFLVPLSVCVSMVVGLSRLDDQFTLMSEIHPEDEPNPSWRNVSTFFDYSDSIVAAQLSRYGVFQNNVSAGVVPDIIQLTIDKNKILYSHYTENIAPEIPILPSLNDHSDFSYFARFESLVEYYEKNASPGLQTGTEDNNDDVILSYKALSEIQDWVITSKTEPATLSDGSIGEAYFITYTTTDDVFSFTISFVGKNATIFNTSLTENSFKINFDITYYNFSRASTNSSAQLALIVAVAAESTSRRTVHSPNSTFPFWSVDIVKNGYNGFIDFEVEADTLDNQGVYTKSPISYHYTEGEYLADDDYGDGWSGGFFVLSYQVFHPLYIQHDPLMGANMDVNPALPNFNHTASGEEISKASNTLVTLLLLIGVVFFDMIFVCK